MIKLFVLGFLWLFVSAQNGNRGTCRVDNISITTVTCSYLELDEGALVLSNPVNPRHYLSIDILNCSKKITEKSLSNLRNLDSMTMIGSTLDEFVLPDLPKLNYVDIRKSRIPTLNGAFKNAKHLSGLELWENNFKLDDNSFTGLTSLQRLKIYKQNVILSKLMLKDMKALYRLIITEANIKIIPKDAFEENTELTTLNLNRNPITTIEEGAFDSLKNLNRLDLESTDLLNFDIDLVKKMNSLEFLGIPARTVKSLNVEKLLDYCPNFKSFIFLQNDGVCPEVQDLQEKLNNYYRKTIMYESDGSFEKSC